MWFAGMYSCKLWTNLSWGILSNVSYVLFTEQTLYSSTVIADEVLYWFPNAQ